jgi:transcriptional regulator with XRE-family HTH domain
MNSPVQRPSTINVAGLMQRIVSKMEADEIGVNELARRTGMSPGNMSMILSAKREQTLAKALLLAHAVGLAHLVDDAR